MPTRVPPPPPGPFVQPNFLAVMEGVGEASFPISKRELLDQVGDNTVVFDGRNVALHDLIKEVHDDFFDSEEELLTALETIFVPTAEETDTEPAVVGRERQFPWRDDTEASDAQDATLRDQRVGVPPRE